MTELDNASLYLYSMTSKGVNIKKELVKIVGKALNLRLSNKNDKDTPSKIQILKNINVFINKGDRIGLIGANGSGKSTILKLISGIYKPSIGQMKGDSFYPMIIRDLNVSDDLAGIDAAKAFFYQHGLGLLGYDLDWFVSKIEETCSIGDYFLRPIKYYSEGMRTRLIFSLLTSVRLSENLAIDEGFGTGDKKFALQAEEKLRSFLGSEGSLLLASHSNDLLRQFCKRGWVMKGGRLIFDGPLEKAFSFYDSKAYLTA
ncbi:MAG: polysaccharide/polyol phosphate ABC transporter ATP-binding protein [Actinomycetales bacterium]|nr:MAG: polysaccharide/polyol phosphate ABC transporter ATP-binding protein [Actinomycetales bacterium]